MAEQVPPMSVWGYWADVLRRGLWESLASIGQSEAQLVFWLVLVCVTAALLWSRGGTTAARTFLVQTAGVVVASVLAWVPFFICQTATVVYTDYVTQLRRANEAEAQLAEAKKQLVQEASGCPPSAPLQFIGRDHMRLEEADFGKVYELRRSTFHPPDGTQAVAARITVGSQPVLWSKDGSKPTRLAESGEQVWVCRDEIPKFRAMHRDRRLVGLLVEYAWLTDR